MVGNVSGDAGGVVEAETVLVERVSRVSTWTAEVRLRFMLMAAVSPLLTVRRLRQGGGDF